MSVVLLWLFACGPLPAETGDTADTGTDGCPAGTHRAVDATLAFTQFKVDQLVIYPAFDATLAYDGVPAACVDDAGTQALLTFAVDGDAYGRITARADAAATYDLTTTDDVYLRIDLFGATSPVVYDVGGDWQNGVLVVRNTGTSFAFDVQGNAYEGEHSLNVQLAAEATP